jgi:NAD(P)H-hydrate repair Nnr-like enzyme with NAD(P)H-hydrate dehydratase domain
MRVGAVVTDLLLFSRIESAARAAGAELIRVDRPAELPVDLDLVLVDWAARRSTWTEELRHQSARVILFGPHTDREAHAAARVAELGPMWARSKLVANLPDMLGARAPSQTPGA